MAQADRENGTGMTNCPTLDPMAIGIGARPLLSGGFLNVEDPGKGT